MLKVELLKKGFKPVFFAEIATTCPEIGLVKIRTKPKISSFIETIVKPEKTNKPKIIKPIPAVSIIPTACIREKTSGNLNNPTLPIRIKIDPIKINKNEIIFIRVSI